MFAPVQRKKRWRVKQKISEDEIILGHAKRGDWGLYSLTFVALPESDGKVSIAAVGGDMRIKTFSDWNQDSCILVEILKKDIVLRLMMDYLE